MPKKLKNLIVFDMDGVIVDVSKSYRETVRQTTRLFFQDAPDWDRLPDPLFSLHDLADIKQSGGLNNDWELTYHVLNLLMTRVRVPDLPDETDPWLLHEQTLKRCKLEGLVDFLTSEGFSLEQLHQEAGKHASPFIQKMSSNDVGTGNIVKQIFQERYLGKNLFKSTYNLPAKTHTGDGLIDRESLLIGPDVFQMLAEINLLALATGRPGAEAEYALDHFKIRPYFRSVFSLDDCLREEKSILEKENKTVSLSKPHPFMLDAIAEIHVQEAARRYYIGDMPDDMLAASRSGYAYTGIGIVTSAPDKIKLQEALLKSGADHVIQNIIALPEILTHHDGKNGCFEAGISVSV
ncbi:MAG: HAD hydrolase-like protein [Desulfobacterales bacterium]|nr:HAD hydrolase-like protein [Desulfobacterales bacterium]MDX2512943.1 HAD hydrolase-like protein [Desulfobacterales bacterium]